MFVHGIQSVLLNNEVQKLANLSLFWSDNVASFDTLPTHQNRAIKSQHEIKTDLILRNGSVHVSVPFGSRTNSKCKWSSLSHWSGDFGVSRARACHYVVVWNALDEGSDVISSLSSAGMFPWHIKVVLERTANASCVKAQWVRAASATWTAYALQTEYMWNRLQIEKSQ